MRPFLRRHGSLLLLTLIGLVAAIAVWLLRGPEAFHHALASSGRLLLVVLPSLGAGLLLSAALRQLLPPGAMARWMGPASGMTGLALATLAGIATPGGPMAAFPLVLVLAQAGADRGAVIAFILSWALNGFARILIWEVPVLGPDFTLLRFLCGLPLPLLAGWIARRLPIAWTPEDSPGLASASARGHGSR
jgi:uncharacterized membrane protein YraQ (UPF0718 family)